MKKLLIFSLLCCINNIHADALSDAIRDTDVEQVKTLLAQKTYTTKAFVKYLDAADEGIRLRREQVISQELKPGMFSDLPESKACRRSLLGGWLGFIAIPFYAVLIQEISSSHESEMEWTLGALGALSCVSIIYGFSKLGSAMRATTSIIRKRHHDAMAIKELLYDYLASFE